MVKAERTAEHEQPRLARAGASAMLLLGGEQRFELTRQDETKLRNILRRRTTIPSTRINAGARADVQNYYQHDHQDGETDEQTHDRRMKRWTSHVDGILESYDKSPAEGFLQKMGINKETGATEMYEKYIVEGESDIVAFAYEILDTHNPRDIRNNMSVIRTISGNLYGRESAKIVEQLVAGMIEGKQNPIRFINAAKKQLSMPDMPGKELIRKLAERNGESPDEAEAAGHTLLRPDMEPGEFKNQLINNLQENSEHGAAVWNFLRKAKGISDKNIEIEPETIASYSDKGLNIKLGTKVMSDYEREKSHFRPDEFLLTYDYEVTYRFLHELGHKLFPILAKKDTPYGELFDNIWNIRDKSKKAVSIHGNKACYTDPKQVPTETIEETQAIEDILELTTMYLIKPIYLREFVDFLADPQKQAERDEHNLIGIHQDGADTIYEIIKGTVQAILEPK